MNKQSFSIQQLKTKMLWRGSRFHMPVRGACGFSWLTERFGTLQIGAAKTSVRGKEGA